MHFRLTVTLKAPRHTQRFGLVNLLHFIDPPMTRDATDPAIDMDAMVKIDVIGQIVYSNPLDGHPRSGAFSYKPQLGAVGGDHAVAIHTRLCWGDGGMSGLVDGIMTKTAIHTQLSRMEQMAIGNRLIRHIT